MTDLTAPDLPEGADLDALQRHLDEALADREFTGGAEPPRVDVRDLVDGTRRIRIDGTATELTLELSRATVRVESRNPLLGLELVRVVTVAGPGYSGPVNFGC